VKVFVTGATGVIVRPVVGLLVERGHDVLGVSRSDGNRDTILQLGGQAVNVNLFDVELLEGYP
jgi:2-alkyl-3-oxoalkanoate reductase